MNTLIAVIRWIFADQDRTKCVAIASGIFMFTVILAPKAVALTISVIIGSLLTALMPLIQMAIFFAIMIMIFKIMLGKK